MVGAAEVEVPSRRSFGATDGALLNALIASSSALRLTRTTPTALWVSDRPATAPPRPAARPAHRRIARDAVSVGQVEIDRLEIGFVVSHPFPRGDGRLGMLERELREAERVVDPDARAGRRGFGEPVARFLDFAGRVQIPSFACQPRHAFGDRGLGVGTRGQRCDVGRTVRTEPET